MTTADDALRLLVHRQNLRNTCIAADTDAHAPLAPGQARMRIDSFALTANNVTYAAFGEAMKYWEFFPAEPSTLGCIPVWGFATVVESRAVGVEPGERCFGFWPIGSHLLVTPARVDAQGFVDGAAHRQALPSAYNRVQFCRSDPGYVQAHEARQALLRPLFITSFLIDDFLAEQSFFGARQVLLSSASSKTAYGTALCLSGRHGDAASVAVTGLTSQANLEFTRSLGCYDQVLAYDDLSALDPEVPTVYVDMSGSAAQRMAVHTHFNGALSYSCAVGGTHWDALGPGSGLPGPRPTLFFAPTQLRKRTHPPPEGWGPEGLQQRIQAAWARLMAAMDGAGRSPWLVVHEGHGVDAVRQAYLSLIEGRTDPRAGHMLSFWPPAAQA
ncbi:DUF2855 family protein [Aquabacterium sp.]|uniref:DUF2855 family protein n=1 Tax=Aquabacterium sp. TaxID=1872578 RepID=UPI002C90B1EC|nr:DUF2855 family protein [Aquabacterium sp.]HSW08236.1 DUF2855 family protein [Aquabacterium sp.]